MAQDTDRIGPWMRRKWFREEHGSWCCDLRDTRKRRGEKKSVRRFNSRSPHRRIAQVRLKTFIEGLDGRKESPLFPIAYRRWISLKPVRPITLAAYEADFKGTFDPAFGKKLVNEITFSDVEDFLKNQREKGNSARTGAKHLIQLRSFFRWAILSHYTTENPCNGLKVAREQVEEKVPLTFDQARRLIQAAGGRVVHQVTSKGTTFAQSYPAPRYLQIAILVALYTGLRRKNILCLDWRHVDFAEGKLSFRGEEMKAGRTHEVPIHPVLQQALEGLLRANEKAVGPILGKAIAGIRASLHSACRRAAVPLIQWHTLRHSFASWCSALGVPPATISRLLAHTSKTTVTKEFNPITGLYVHPDWPQCVSAIARLPDLLMAPVATAASQL